MQFRCATYASAKPSPIAASGLREIIWPQLQSAQALGKIIESAAKHRVKFNHSILWMTNTPHKIKIGDSIAEALVMQQGERVKPARCTQKMSSAQRGEVQQ